MGWGICDRAEPRFYGIRRAYGGTWGMSARDARRLVRAACAAMLCAMNEPQPLHLTTLTVAPQWIDYNGHMNVGYYGVAFDLAADVFIDGLGMDAAYRDRDHCSVYVLETRTGFLRELKQGECVAVDVQLLDFDAKRLHYFMRMLHSEDGALCAWIEIMLLHVDTLAVGATPMSAAVLDKVRQLAQSQQKLPRPALLGQAIGIRR